MHNSDDMHDLLDEPDTVHVHVKVSPRARTALKVAAAARGLTVGRLVEKWALSEADAAAFIDRLSTVAKAAK